MNKRLIIVTSIGLAMAIVVVSIGAWIISILGYDVQNVLSTEGLRWLFTHALDDEYHFLPSMLLILMALGATEKRSWAVWLPALLLAMILLFFTPLRGVTGGLFPSPYVLGILPVACAVTVIMSLSMGRAGQWQRICRHLPWLLVCLLGLVLLNLIRFIC